MEGFTFSGDDLWINNLKYNDILKWMCSSD